MACRLAIIVAGRLLEASRSETVVVCVREVDMKRTPVVVVVVVVDTERSFRRSGTSKTVENVWGNGAKETASRQFL